MARLKRRKEAQIERIRGPYFPKGIGRLTVLFQQTPLEYTDMLNLYRLVTNCIGCAFVQSNDGYHWFANLFFLVGQGHVQILFPQRGDNTSAAVYQQGGRVTNKEMIEVVEAVTLALPKLPGLRGTDPKTGRKIDG